MAITKKIMAIDFLNTIYSNLFEYKRNHFIFDIILLILYLVSNNLLLICIYKALKMHLK